MDGVIFAIYTISLISAFVCLWVKWEQDEEKYKISALERKQKELEAQVLELTQQAKKAGGKTALWK